jgi:hypothetical protein
LKKLNCTIFFVSLLWASATRPWKIWTELPCRWNARPRTFPLKLLDALDRATGLAPSESTTLALGRSPLPEQVGGNTTSAPSFWPPPPSSSVWPGPCAHMQRTHGARPAGESKHQTPRVKTAEERTEKKRDGATRNRVARRRVGEPHRVAGAG